MFDKSDAKYISEVMAATEETRRLYHLQAWISLQSEALRRSPACGTSPAKCRKIALGSLSKLAVGLEFSLSDT